MSIRLIAEEVQRKAAGALTVLDEVIGCSLDSMMAKARMAVARAQLQLQELEDAVSQGRVPRHRGLVMRIRNIPMVAATASVATYKAAATAPPSKPQRICSGSRSRIKEGTSNNNQENTVGGQAKRLAYIPVQNASPLGTSAKGSIRGAQQRTGQSRCGRSVLLGLQQDAAAG